VKILVADDSRVMRQIVIRTLRQAGYDDHDIVEAEDGADALAKVGRRSRTWSCRTGTCRT
jgi:two-component system chemotaxis response regulator CheY